MMLSAHNVSCQRNYHTLFKDLSFELNSGQLLQIMGQNGSGKTTLLRMLAGLGQPASGEIFWQKNRISSLGYAFYKQFIYVGHVMGVKYDLSPIENLNIIQGLSSNPTLSPKQALEILNLKPVYYNKPCGLLSAGQKRRVALARLLLRDAPLWLLDEPLTAMDTDGILLVTNLIEAHLEKGGLAVISTHQTLPLKNSKPQIVSLSLKEGEDV